MPNTPQKVGNPEDQPKPAARKRAPSGVLLSPLSVRLMPDERAHVEALAHARCQTLAALSRECLLVGLKKLDKPARRAKKGA